MNTPKRELTELIAHEFAVNPGSTRASAAASSILAHNWVKHLVIETAEELDLLGPGSVVIDSVGNVFKANYASDSSLFPRTRWSAVGTEFSFWPDDTIFVKPMIALIATQSVHFKSD